MVKTLLMVPIVLQWIFCAEPVAQPYLAFPRPYEQNTLHYAFGASITLFPRFVVEEEIRQIPMLSTAIRYGLSSNISLTANISSVYITNAISAGAMWSYSMGNTSLALSDEFSYWFGFADFEGFDTKAMGLFNRPGITLGIDIDSYKISAKTEMLILISQHTFFGSASVGRIKPEIAGVAATIVLEQDLWNFTFISFALRANYARPNYQVWLAFSVQDRWILYPELQTAILF